jgi:hypothetical protein
MMCDHASNILKKKPSLEGVAVSLNPDRSGGLTRDLVDLGAGLVWVCQKPGQCNDPAKPGRPNGLTPDPVNPGKTRCFILYFQI